VQIVPLRLEFTVAVKHLQPVVLAIGDIDPAIGIAADVVRHIELPGIGAGLAPRKQQFAVGGEFVDAGIAVAVRHVNVAARRQCGVRAVVERLTAHIGFGLAGHAESHQDVAVERTVADGVVAVIG
jgi:hypothetical protein